MKHSLFGVLFLTTLMAAPVSAHHSLAVYDTARNRTIEGIVKKFFWGNPHTTLTIIAEKTNGAFTGWTFEGGSVNRLCRGDFNENTVVPGDRITVSYHRNMDDSIGGFFLAVTTPSGTLYSLPRFHGISEE